MAVQANTPAATRGLAASVAGLIALRAAERPDTVAIEDGATRLTYAELDAAAARVAGGLLAAGAGPEEPVAVCLPRGWQTVCAFLGTLHAGAAYLPLGDAQPPGRRRRLLELAGARLAIEAGDGREQLAEPARALDIERLLDGDADPAPFPAIEPERLAYVLFTSGSTGEPKDVMLSRGNMAANVLNLLRRDRTGETDVRISHAALHYIASIDLLFAPRCGSRAVLMSEREAMFPDRVADAMARERITM